MTAVINFVEPWGYSKLDVFRTCPAKFKYQFIDKRPQDSSPAMERGDKMHKNIESYLKDWTNELIEENSEWKIHFDELKKEDFRGEQALGLDKNWKVLKNWFGKDVWVRIKMDAYYLDPVENAVVVIDFKSGKYRVPSTDQIELYAIAGLSLFPDIPKVRAEFWFLDQMETYMKTYTAEQLVELRKKYENDSAAIYTEQAWSPTPSMECRWCSYSKHKGGPCQY
jgi:hypothetical protein